MANFFLKLVFDWFNDHVVTAQWSNKEKDNSNTDQSYYLESVEMALDDQGLVYLNIDGLTPDNEESKTN